MNNLPQLVADVASSLGDSLIFDSNTPGGYTLQGHSTNATSLAKIAQGGWDCVVLQEQSQLPSFPWNQFSTASLPYADSLCEKIRNADSCTIPMFYMTWGRKNGDQSNCAVWPPVCTYGGMQQLLRERYMLMADTNQAQVAPVGAVWRDLIADSLGIELYQSDESHPSLEGSYLAACTFYASIFHKSPIGATIPGFINPLDAQAIQQKANQIVFDSLNVWMIDTLSPHASFTFMIHSTGDSVLFDASTSLNIDSAYWHFGDGTFGFGIQTAHKYAAPGNYNVVLEVWRNCEVDSVSYPLLIGNPWSVDEDLLGVSIFPNPTSNVLRIEQKGVSLNAHLILYSIDGELVIEDENQSQINLSNLPAGIYILEIRVDQKVSRLKVVRE